MLPPHDQLALRLTVIGGETRADDYQVIWNALAIGRIMKQTGLPPGSAAWSWSIIFAHRPQASWHRGHGRDLEEAKQRFRLAWSAVHPDITEADVAAMRDDEAALALRPWNRRGDSQ